jgi:cobalamin biosynthesis Mg chelatase CobN
VRTLQDQVALETRSRSLNPKWFEGLLKHGHEGVRQIEAQVTNTLGWSATTGQVEPWVYQRISETFVLDDEMRRRLAELNPAASARMANRLLEASTATTGSPTRRRSKRCRMARTNSRTGWKGCGRRSRRIGRKDDEPTRRCANPDAAERRRTAKDRWPGPSGTRSR